MMYYAYRYRLKPSASHRETLDHHRDICRQLYNHTRYRLNEYREEYGETPAMTTLRSELPGLKERWDDLNDVYSKVLQTVVERLFHNLRALSKLKQYGYEVGALKWKPPRDYRSFTYNQSGFKLDKKSGQTVLSLSKIGDIPIRLHRPIPEDATIKQVTVKKEPTGEWFASFGMELHRERPAKPEQPEKVIGIDVGILKYVHDTDGIAVTSLDLSDERERLEHEQRKLTRKEHGSNNWMKQRRIVARRHTDLKRKRRDFLHKLSSYYARVYDLVAVEDLDTKGLVELPGNSRNRAAAAWATFRSLLEYKCEREGTHFVAVEPARTTTECASCGVSTAKPLWIREHACPACGFTADRDANSALNILSRGLQEVGVGHSESTPVETALPTDTVVSAKRVVETGSPVRSERKRASRTE